jgi:hypothetical protein
MKKTLLVCLLAALLMPLHAEKPKRYVELGVDVDAAAANNFLGLTDIFNREGVVQVDLSRVPDSGFLVDAAGGAEVFLNVNVGEKFGLGFFGGLDFAFYGTLSQEIFKLLSQGNVDMRDFSSTMAVGASVFVDAGLKTRFKFGKLSLGFTPAVYIPLVYVPPPQVSYHLDTTEGVQADISLNANAYAPLSLEDLFDTFGFTDSGSGKNGKDQSKSAQFNLGPDEVMHILEAWGLDASLNAEYALNAKWDLGGAIDSIPLYPATLRHGLNYQFDYRLDPLGGKDLIEIIKDEDFDIEQPEMNDPVFYDDLAFRVFRPLRVDFYVLYRPFSTKLVVLKPRIGFSALTVYGYEADKMCFNAGLEAQLNLKRIFSVSLGTDYRERLWSHNLGLMLNLRVVELDLGVGLQSQDFAGSFRIEGARAFLGLRLGF